MSNEIKNIILDENMIHLKIRMGGKTETKSINLKEKGIYSDNEKQVTIQILKYAIENNYEFNCYNKKTKPYFLTLNNINKMQEKKEKVISDDLLLYREFENAKIGLYIQFKQIGEYLYKNTEINVNPNGIVESIDIQVEFQKVKNMFKEPIKISKDEYKKALQENQERIFNCKYFISETGKRYIVLKNDDEVNEGNIYMINLINKRNELFSRYTGISNIHLIDNNFCVDDSFLGCLHYESRKELMEHLHKTEVIEKIDFCENNEEER